MTTEQSTEPAPSAQAMIRDDDKDEEDSAAIILVEPLSSRYFDRAREIENEFFGTNKGFCFGACPFSWCPQSKTEFEPFYVKHPDRCSTYGVAIRRSDGLAVGVICLRIGGQASKSEENFIHQVARDECYVDHLAVTKEARGMGAGTKLLEWAEAVAKARGAKRMTLGVVNGNPAKRLYDRVGYVDDHTDCFTTWCLLGRPHGQLGSTFMEKRMV